MDPPPVRAEGPVVLVVDHVSPYSLGVVSAVREVLVPQGVPLLVHVDDLFATGTTRSWERWLERDRVRGVITVPLLTPAAHADLEAILAAHPDLPVVSLSSAPRGRASVVTHSASGMAALVEHVLAQPGVRSVALVRGMPHHVDSRAREEVVREVLALNDAGALGALDAVLDAGLRVPEDVVVTGFDDDGTTHPRCTLTTVSQDLPAQGRTAAELLLEPIAGGPGRDVVLPTHLVARGSSAPTATPAGTVGATTRAAAGPGVPAAPGVPADALLGLSRASWRAPTRRPCRRRRPRACRACGSPAASSCCASRAPPPPDAWCSCGSPAPTLPHRWTRRRSRWPTSCRPPPRTGSSGAR